MKFFSAIALTLFLTVNVLATDVTIGATSQPNFNPTGLATAATVSNVTIVNGTNALLTCAACFRPQWVGMGGFYITVGVQNYYVKNVDNTSQVTLASSCPETSPATVTWHPYVELRIYADRAFQPLGESYIVQPGTPGTGSWYKRYGASVITVSGVRTLYIPELVIDATTDAVGPTNQARYTAAFYRPDNSLIQIYSCADQFRVPPVTPTGWTSLCQFNNPPAIVPPANEAYTKTQIDARLITCTTGQMIYYAATGNQPSCLNVGTGLTITAGALLTIGGTQQSINVVTDYGCDPTDNGGTADQTCLQSAINAAAASGGKTVYVPTGVYNVSGISIPGGVTVMGDGRNRSIVKSSTNATIVSLTEGAGSYEFFGPSVRSIGITGSVTAGSSQTGLLVTDNLYFFNVQVSTIDVLNTGGIGVSIGNAYSSMFTDLYIDNAAGFPFNYDAVNMPQNVFDKIYIGNLRASAPVAFRVKGGEFTCRGCNGVNNVLAGSSWAVVGKSVADGGANGAAKFTCIDCNMEDWTAYGVRSYYGSTVTLKGQTKIQMNASGSGTGIPIYFDMTGNGTTYYSELIMKGYLEDTVQFTQAITQYANSQAIHSQGVPPVQTFGVGPEIVTAGSSDRVSTYYNTSLSAIGYLARADGYAEKIAVTGTTTLSTPLGTRYVEANCSSACTITIPWAGWYQVTDAITIKDVSGNAGIYNVTIASSGGGTVNGSSYVLSRSGESVTLRPDGANDWRIVAAYVQTAKDVRQAINLLDFGCDPSDNANNDTACIVAAITAAQGSSSKTLYVPTGTFNTDAISASMGNLKIVGDGMMKSIIKARSSNQNVISLTGASYAYRLSIEDVGVKGAGKATGSTGHCIYINDNAGGQLSEFAFKRMRVTDCREDGFNIPYLFNGVFEGNQTDSIGGHHFNLGAANSVTMTGNYVHTVEANKVGFKLTGGQYTLIGNNGMAPNSASTAKWGEFGDNAIPSYFRGTLLGNNIEDFGSVGLLFKVASYGVFHGNIFTTKSSGAHVAIQFEYIDNEMGLFDTATNRLILQDSATWSNSYPIHSYRPPFMVLGATTGGSAYRYYDTALTAARNLPAWYAANDTTEGDVFAKLANLASDTMRVGEAGVIDGKVAFLNATNGSRLYLKAGATSTATTFTLPTGVPAGNDYLLKSSTAGVMGWTTVTGTGNAVLATSPTITSPILNNTTFGSLSGSATNGTVIICTDCKPNATTGTCEGSGNGSLAMRISGAWKCN